MGIIDIILAYYYIKILKSKKRGLLDWIKFKVI